METTASPTRSRTPSAKALGVYDHDDSRIHAPVRARHVSCRTARREVAHAIVYSKGDEAYWSAKGWATRTTTYLDYPLRATKGRKAIQYRLPTGGPFHEG